jgi:ubiquinone/menaquinone biosynthesis C-methylase UbiE
MNTYSKHVGETWNRKVPNPGKPRTNWWNIPRFCGYFNEKICGDPLPGVSNGVETRLKALGPFQRAVSVGCGLATKEERLLRRGIAKHFELYDLSSARIEVARKRFEEHGVGERANLCVANAFEEVRECKYDLVYWASSLHHMQDTQAALEWSHSVLKPNGLLVMHEYTGPTRWQYSDDLLRSLRSFREALPPQLKPKTTELPRLTIDQMLERDPSEAADSESIVPSLKCIFPSAEIVALGGAVLPHALRGAYQKIGPDDSWVYDMVLAFDMTTLQAGESHHTFALARK